MSVIPRDKAVTTVFITCVRRDILGWRSVVVAWQARRKDDHISCYFSYGQFVTEYRALASSAYAGNS